MAIFKKSSPIEKLRADIGALESRRAALGEQRIAATASLETARAVARDALIAGEDKFDDTTVLNAERRLAAVDDALAEIARRIEDANAALAEIEDTKAREDEAKSREAASAKIEPIAVRLDRAIADLADVAAELRDALPSCLEIQEYREIWGLAGALPTTTIVGAAIAEGLFKKAPELFTTTSHADIGMQWRAEIQLRRRRPDGSLADHFEKSEPREFLHASGAVEQTIIRPLRESAALIRSGELPADAPAKLSPPPVTIEPALPPLRRVELAKPIRYVDHRGVAVVEHGPFAHIPDLAAVAAAAKGALVIGASAPAYRTRTEEKELERQRREAEPVDLGINIKSLIDAERERLNHHREAAE